MTARRGAMARPRATVGAGDSPRASRARRVPRGLQIEGIAHIGAQAGVPAADGVLATRGARRKHRSRERLLDAALSVFLSRGYDGATTTEMATLADLGVGTFYCHFRDKRAAFEGLAHRASRTMMERWLAAIAPGMTLEQGVVVALETTAAFWRENRGRARLLLEDGPSFGTAAHLRLLNDVATTLRVRFRSRTGATLRVARAHALATVVVGLGVELGRIVLGHSEREAARIVASTLAIARHVTAGRVT